jgi:2-methylisocitrate lyase-like PEP mutase family enzyme
VTDGWDHWLEGKRQFVLAPGVYDGLSAKIAGTIGFDVLYMTGFGTAASMGMPDVGLATLTEMAANVGRVVEASGLPVIADADTGYGNPLNVQRTVRAYERAGAAALHLEDQVFPKKCGFFEGKRVIPAAEHVQKIQAACDARSGDRFVIIARTDALAVNGWDDVVDRVHAYREAGADVVFVDGIRTREDLDNYVSRVVAPGLPALYNGALISADEADRLGFRIQILAGAALFAAYSSMYQALARVRETGSYPADAAVLTDGAANGQLPAITDVLGLPDVYGLERRYQVGTEAG